MSLKILRDQLYARVDWAPTASTTQETRANAFLNEAIRRLARDAPFAFFEQKVEIGVRPVWDSTESGLSNDTVSVYSSGGTNDYLVLKRDRTMDTATNTDLTLYWQQTVWAGHFVEFTYSGRTYRHQIRTTWAENTSGTTWQEYMSLVNPFNAGTLGSVGGNYSPTALAADYKVFAPAWPMPRGVISVKSIRLQYSGENSPLHPVLQDEAERSGYLDVTGNVASGRPRMWFRSQPFQLRGPLTAPTVAVSGGTWGTSGGFTPNEPAGAFEYLFTYCWGHRDVGPYPGEGMGILAASGEIPFPYPLYESAPSPASSEVSTTWGGTGITVTLPDIDHILGYDTSTAKRYRQSGIRKRIYRRRKSIVSGGGNTNIQVSDNFHFMFEVSGSTTTWNDVGLYTPNYYDRITPTEPWTGQHQMIGLWPRPDAVYALDVRAVMEPAPLVDDYDSPPVDAAAWPALLDFAEYRLRTALGDAQGAQLALRHYEGVELPALSKTYGAGQPASHVGVRRQAGVRRTSAAPRKWW